MVMESQVEMCLFHEGQGKSVKVRETYNGQGEIILCNVGQGKTVIFYHHRRISFIYITL